MCLKPNNAMGEDYCEILSLLANHYRMEWNEGLDHYHPVELAMYSNAPMAIFNMLLGHDLLNVPADSRRRCLQVAVRAERLDWLNALMGSGLVLPWSMLMLEKKSTVMSLLGWSIKNLAADNVKFLLDVEGVDPAVCGTGVYRPSDINALILCMTMNYTLGPCHRKCQVINPARHS